MDEENAFLCRSLDMLEVKDILFSIPKYSTPGLDGFGSEFYMAYWKIVKEDVLEAVQEFCSGSPLLEIIYFFFYCAHPKGKRSAEFW